MWLGIHRGGMLVAFLHLFVPRPLCKLLLDLTEAFLREGAEMWNSMLHVGNNPALGYLEA